MDVLEGMTLNNTHPGLQKAWARYSAKGYTIDAIDTYELTGSKVGVFSNPTVTLRVDYDGSVLVEEDGALTASVYVIPAGPGIPTVAEFEARQAQQARPADHAQANQSTSSPGGHASSPKHGSDTERQALQVLGLHPGASKHGIQEAYRRKAAEYHPDKFASAPREFRDLAHAKMTELNQARDLLLG